MSSPEAAHDDQLRELVDRHGPRLARFISVMAFTQDTDDLVQETMIRAWRNLDAIPTDDQAGRRWLFTVARHVVIDECRRRRARPVQVDPPGDCVTTDDETASTAVANVALHEALSRLSKAHREVLTETFVENRSPVEVAARLGIPIGTVRSRLHYALRALRDAVIS